MLYSLFQKISNVWWAFRWIVWDSRKAWDIANGGDYNNLEVVMRLHAEAASRDQMLLASKLESVLNEADCYVVFCDNQT